VPWQLVLTIGLLAGYIVGVFDGTYTIIRAIRREGLAAVYKGKFIFFRKDDSDGE